MTRADETPADRLTRLTDSVMNGVTRAEREEASTDLLSWCKAGGSIGGGFLGMAAVCRAREVVAERQRRTKRNAQARERRAILSDVACSLGMRVVRGPVSGRLYLE